MLKSTLQRIGAILTVFQVFTGVWAVFRVRRSPELEQVLLPKHSELIQGKHRFLTFLSSHMIF